MGTVELKNALDQHPGFLLEMCRQTLAPHDDEDWDWLFSAYRASEQYAYRATRAPPEEKPEMPALPKQMMMIPMMMMGRSRYQKTCSRWPEPLSRGGARTGITCGPGNIGEGFHHDNVGLKSSGVRPPEWIHSWLRRILRVEIRELSCRYRETYRALISFLWPRFHE